jgi:Tannase and feruloyl esterase
MKIVRGAVFVTGFFVTTPVFAATCESLASLKLPATTIAAAQVVAAGGFRPSSPPSAAALKSFENLPAFCRVQGVIQPSSDSHIEFEVWLPMSGWNGKYLGVGNGGFAGSIIYTLSALEASNIPSLREALVAGYAASSTDTGHQAGQLDAKWALGHPEKVVDFGYRAVHETAQKSKAIIRAFYGDGPKHSYFDGCSNGGRHALMEAQRYPADYDGLIAGAPVGSMTRIGASFTWDLQATEIDPASYIPANKYPAIEAAALAACDARDGLKDGVIDDPTTCAFKPATLLCSGPESATCLTQSQITALEKIYAGPRNSQGQQMYPGFLPGGESGPVGWALYVSGAAPRTSLQYVLDTQGGANLTYQDAAWDFRTYNLDRDVKIADDTMGRQLNAVDPNLKALETRGGKLIMFHGWSDPALPPMGTVNYYNSVVTKMGRKDTERFSRLYMVPGLQHCYGGPGPNTFGAAMTAALEHWVEGGVAPGAIIATKYKTDGDPSSGVVRTRPLCPYPQVARYKGTGTTDEAANFTCKAP